MTRNDYLEWIRQVVEQIAKNKYPDNPNLQRIYQLGMLERALADLCYIDTDNARLVNRMLKRNINTNTKQFKPKR